MQARKGTGFKVAGSGAVREVKVKLAEKKGPMGVKSLGKADISEVLTVRPDGKGGCRSLQQVPPFLQSPHD